MKVPIVAILFVTSCFAAQSVNVVNSGDFAQVTLSNSAFSSSGTASQRWEARVHNIAGITSADLFNLGPMQIIIISGTTLALTNQVSTPATDTLSAAPTAITITGYTDVLIQAQRDVAGMTWTLQMCATQGGLCQISVYPIVSLGTTNDWQAFTMAIFYGQDFAWLRWFSTLVPTSNVILNTNTGNVLDWEFEGTLVDSVLGLTLSGTTVAYTTTPIYNPSCNPITQQTMMVGKVGTVTVANLCQPLDGGSTLTYLWTYAGTGADGVTQSLTFGTATVATTTVSGMIKGGVNLNLAATDGSSNATTIEVHDGAVSVNSNDVVVTGLPTEQDAILGPMLRWGSTNLRDPWYDPTIKNLVELQGNALATNFPVYWDSAQGQPSGTWEAGTVQVGPTVTCGGSGTGFGVIGTGTAFTMLPGLNWSASSTSVLINGPGTYTFTVSSGLGYTMGGLVVATSDANSANNLLGIVASYSGTTLVITVVTGGASGSGTHTDWNVITPDLYNVVAWNSGANRSLTQIMSVTSDSCMLLAYPWEISTESGLNFSGPVNIGGWGFGTANIVANFYDNVKAFRSFYERSGFDYIYPYYTYLADNFWRNPAIDEGLSAQGGYAYAYTNRYESLEGMLLRSEDSGMSGMKAGIDQIISYNNETILTNQQNFQGFGDTRVNAYALGAVALGAQYSPTPANVTSFKAALSTVVPYYDAGLAPLGNIPTLEFTKTNVGTATVTNGSTAVTCSGCDFTVAGFMGPSGLNPPSFVTYPGPCGTTPPIDNSTFSTVYYPTVNSSTSITLNRVYSETSGTPCWAYAPGQQVYVTGWGNQPFMVGIESAYMFTAATSIAASDPTNSALAITLANSDAGWLTQYGYADPAHAGLGGAYYLQGYLPCMYPIQTVQCTLGNTASQNRADAPFMVRALTAAYQLAPTTAKANFLKTLLDQMFCKPGYTSGSQGAGLTCTTDGLYISDLDPGGSFMSSAAVAAKWLGIFGGFPAIENAFADLASNGAAAGAVCSGPCGVFR